MRLLAASALFFTLTAPVLAVNDHYREGDLISVHWDSSYDYDDLQSMPATREVFNAYSGLDYLAINGTKSNENKGIIEGSSDIMRMVFPDGLDAFNNKSNTLYAAADRWQKILQSGGTVHVAESGPSDFTADLIRELESRNVANLKNIRVVQHSSWNERHTSTANLALVKRTSSYIRIEDGNQDNATAWLRTNNNQVAAFRNLTSQSEYGHVWDTAFQAVYNNDRFVDFSDVVEILEILDVPRSKVANAFDFADVYFGSGNAQEPAPAAAVVPSQSASQDPARVAVYGSTLQAARDNYRRATSLRRVDCDVAGGGYVCASFQNPTLADTQTSPVEVPVEPTVPATPTPTPTPTGDRVAVYGSTLAAARNGYANATSLPRVDCDRSGSGYICASFNNPSSSDVGGQVEAPQVTPPVVSPEQPASPVTNAGSGDTIRLEVENYRLGSGWAKDTNRSGYSGSGYIRWADANRYNISLAGKGIMTFPVKPAVSGEYTLRLRSRALNPAASDLSNDVWLRMNGSSWMKIFNTGKDQWIVGGKVDAHSKRYVLKQNLTAGETYQLEISGRSNGFAIDYIELVKN